MTVPARWVGLIPARGGSKSIPRKNIADVDGIPLIAYTIQCALQSKCLASVVVVTEDEEIAEVAHKWGANIIRRPPELATDSSPTEPSLTYALTAMRERLGLTFDVMALLQCTSPLRNIADIRSAVEILAHRPEFDAVMTLAPLEAHYHPMWIKQVDAAGEVRSFWQEDGGRELKILEKGAFYQRQRLIGSYHFKDGSIFASRVPAYEKLGHRYGERCTYVPMSPERAFNIDSQFELDLVRALVRERLVSLDFDPRHCIREQSQWSI